MSEFQAIASGVLAALKLEPPEASNVRGGPQKWKVGQSAVAFIKSLEGKTVTVDSKGSATVEGQPAPEETVAVG